MVSLKCFWEGVCDLIYYIETQYISVTTNSGVIHPDNGIERTDTYTSKTSSLNRSTGFNGSVVINFGFFFARGK
jgi:hypothetical protein